MIDPTARKLLEALRELATDDDGDVLRNCYGIDLQDPDDCPLENALVAWVGAGSPVPVGLPNDGWSHLKGVFFHASGHSVTPNGSKWVVYTPEGDMLRNSLGAFRRWGTREAACAVVDAL